MKQVIKRCLLKLGAGILAMLILLALMPHTRVAADDSPFYTLDLALNAEQKEARRMLGMINALRTAADGSASYWNEDGTKTVYNTDGNLKLGELKYDARLEQIALMRAAELVVNYSNTRPDGSAWHTLYTQNCVAKTYGENIAYGLNSYKAEDYFDSFTETDNGYEGQGHRRNMLSPYFNAVGIACLTMDNVTFYVQAFALVEETEDAEAPVVGPMQFELTVPAAELKISSIEIPEPAAVMPLDSTAPLPTVAGQFRFVHSVEGLPVVMASLEPNWIPLNPEVAKVASGQLVAVAPGTTRLYWTVGDSEVHYSVTVLNADGTSPVQEPESLPEQESSAPAPRDDSKEKPFDKLPFELPAEFDTLSAAEQQFILISFCVLLGLLLLLIPLFIMAAKNRK